MPVEEWERMEQEPGTRVETGVTGWGEGLPPYPIPPPEPHMRHLRLTPVILLEQA